MKLNRKTLNKQTEVVNLEQTSFKDGNTYASSGNPDNIVSVLAHGNGVIAVWDNVVMAFSDEHSFQEWLDDNNEPMIFVPTDLKPELTIC